MNKLLVSIIGVFLLYSCGKDVNPPTFLKINDFILEENPSASSLQGELTHNFSDAWVYIDGELLGVFELPCKLPLDYEGSHKLQIVAGVRKNGISASKVRYPFVEVYSEQINFTRLDTTTVTPVTRYFSGLNFWIEDFEDASVKIQSTIYSKTDLYKDNDPEILKYGNFYGRVDLNTTDSLWEAATTDMWNIPKGQDVYIEIDYYNTNSILTSVKAINQDGFNVNAHVLLNTQYEGNVVWKKMYIDIREIVSYSVNYNQFQLLFTSILQTGMSDSYAIIDNIKLIHF
ncbi:hypothetical protein GCM10009118_18010 [Wandonia haliotis]|uniref:Uncharacterized protein n=1 Tax=Wandonia haliotis TaxID=574963 RepID=A0ABP3Y3N5_9FLAO